MKATSRRCANCRKKVDIDVAILSSLKAFCTYDCLKEFTARNADKLREKVRKEKRGEEKKARDRLKTKSQWTKEAQKAFNAYIRARDRNKPCISCGIPQTDEANKFDAGHYRSTGSAPHLRFNLLNCFAQCKKCNRWLSGNVADYRRNLISRLGVHRVEALEADQDIRNFDIAYLKRVKAIFTKRCKLIEKKC